MCGLLPHCFGIETFVLKQVNMSFQSKPVSRQHHTLYRGCKFNANISILLLLLYYLKQDK